MIDSHIHIWDAHQFPMAWLAGMPRLASCYQADDLVAEAGDSRPDGAVVVQAGVSAEATRWLLRLAEQAPMVAAVVGAYRLGDEQTWVDLQRRIRAAQQAPGGEQLRGFRISGRGHGDDVFGRQGAREALTLLAGEGLVAQVLAEPAQLRDLARTLGRLPRPMVVIDHLGSPPLGGDLSHWRDGLAAVAAVGTVVAKVSGAELLSPRHAGASKAAVEWAVRCFGGARLMFGSDWPMSRVVLPYPQVVARVQELMCGPDGDRSGDSFWNGLACQVYRI